MTAPEVRLAALSANLNAGYGTAERLLFADLSALLSPIDPASPAGEWLRYDPAFDNLRELRREDDTTTPQGIWARDLKRADLPGVHRLATDLLARRTKDLQIAAWLLEAWIRLHGFAGARLGFALVLGLCDQYWAELHPLPDGDDYGARAATIEWVNERLPARLLDVAVTKPSDIDGRAFTWGERAEALRRETLVKRLGKNAKPQPAKASDDWLTTAKFTTSAGTTPTEFFADLESDLGATLDSVRVLQTLLDERCGNAAPSLRRIADLLTEIRRFAAVMLEERGGVPASAPASAVAAPATSAPSPAADAAAGAAPSSLLDDVMQQTPTMPPMPGASAPSVSAPPVDQVAARTEAYRKLAEAADTLMRIEPHSPTPYLVRRAIAWGGMSLAELMRHFIDSGYDLKSLYTMLGMGE